MQKKIVFHHNKEIDMLKLGCTLPNLANICLHKSTAAKFYPFTEKDKDFWKRYAKTWLGRSLLFTRKAVVDKSFIRDSPNLCKSIVGIAAPQLCSYSICQEMPTRLYTRWYYDSELGKFKPKQNKTRSYENLVMSYYQRHRPHWKIFSFYSTGKQKKIDCFV